MNPELAEGRYTAEDLPRIENGDVYELVDGRLVERNMGAEAGVVAANIISLVRVFLREHDLGRVFSQDCGYQIFADDVNRVRKPDLSVILHGRLPENRVPRGFVRIAPDLVGEIVSPNDLAEDVNNRIVDYLRAGVRLIWVLYPATGFVHVFRPGGGASYLTRADQLSGEDVLPNFTCRVEELFAGL
jgi:Uma2 family endonuclease